jgi:hypothetical protein
MVAHALHEDMTKHAACSAQVSMLVPALMPEHKPHGVSM